MEEFTKQNVIKNIATDQMEKCENGVYEGKVYELK
jgi:hypothetical protein